MNTHNFFIFYFPEMKFCCELISSFGESKLMDVVKFMKVCR